MSKTTNQAKIAVLKIWLEDLKLNKKRPRKRTIVDLDDE
jgi:hypothetical protein